MMAIHILWTISHISYRLVRLLGRALRDLAVVLWRFGLIQPSQQCIEADIAKIAELIVA